MEPWKPVVLALSVVVGAGVTCPACSSEGADGRLSAEQTTTEGPVDIAGVEFEVRGMTCGGCALATKMALARLDGVVRADADYEKGTGTGWARIEYEPQRVTPEQIAAAIVDVGFEPVPGRSAVARDK